MKITPVLIAGTEDDVVVVVNENKPDYASMMLEQLVFVNNNGFLNKKRRVAFLTGTVEQMQEFANMMGAAKGKELPGHLYVKETFYPQYEGHQPKCNPRTGRACLVDGALVYWKTYYDDTGTRGDEMITGEVSEGAQIMNPESLEDNPVARRLRSPLQPEISTS